jgi:16S rRNA (guanine527-N7)-methyltransferase
LDLLKDGLTELCKADNDIAICIHNKIDELSSRLERYIAEIELFNPVYGLVSCKNRDELIIRHILDSLSPLGIIIRELNRKENEAGMGADSASVIADAGSGAGLPGVPLAMTLEDRKFVLIERMERRADFLRNVSALLKLKNVSIEQNPIENLHKSSFDIITFRAFRPLSADLLKTLFRLLKPNGTLAAYKGRNEKIQEEARSEPEAEWSVFPCPVPFLQEERHLALISQRKSYSR